ncbi:Chromosome transmission fidelity protein 18 [Rhodosporidiobolus nylandii]
MAALAELNRLPGARSGASALGAKRMTLEPLDDDEDWAAQVALAEAEAEEEAFAAVHGSSGGGHARVEANKTRVVVEEDVDMDVLAEIEAQEEEERRKQAGGSSAGGWVAKDKEVKKATPPRKDVKGKGRMVFEEDEAFGEEELVFSQAPRPALDAATTSHMHDYTSRFGSVTSLNLSGLQPGYIEAAPVQATRLDGRQFFLKRRKKLDNWTGGDRSKKETTAALASLAASMLDQPYHRIMQSIEHDLTMEKKRREADAANPAMLVETKTTTTVETMLWTDRYRPKRFVDLLGDERLHRTALLWLKEWDACVFKGTQKANAAAEMKRERSKKRAREGGGGGGFGGGGGGGFEEAVLLLSGPPGLGKTTLAHVLARQAGYQVLEINASDDRTGGVVEQRIRNALESSALTLNAGVSKKGKDERPRPTCVVIDEVDGAAGGGEGSFVRTLVKMITEGSSTRKPSKKGKGKQPRPLLRPIICICNDLYAPALRPLRPLAKIIRFTPPTSAMLVKRLRTICDVEELATENKHLSLLVDTAEGDLRSCLNTLQFIKRNGSTVDAGAIRSSTLGAKDTGTSSAQVLDRLFKKPPRKRGAPTDAGVGADERYVQRIVKDVQTSGEYEKISQGCFENYLTARGTNAEAFPKVLDALDWLFLYDRLDGRLRSEREYELLAYVPYAFAPWYHLFSSQVPKPVELPKTDYEMFLKRTAHQEVADHFAQNIPHTLKTLFTGTNIVGELLPLLNRIVAPDLKPVNSQVVKNEERKTLLRLVNTMITTKLAFVLDKAEDGQLSYKLDPPIDVFVHFDGKRASDIAPGRYAVRQMINREIDAELLRRGGEGKEGLKTAGEILSAYKVAPVAAPVPADTKQAVDFFGRTIVAKAPQPEEPVAGEDTVMPPAPPKKRVRQAMYRYNEGFSNAVRVTKRVSDFLL